MFQYNTCQSVQPPPDAYHESIDTYGGIVWAEHLPSKPVHSLLEGIFHASVYIFALCVCHKWCSRHLLANYDFLEQFVLTPLEHLFS